MSNEKVPYPNSSEEPPLYPMPDNRPVYPSNGTRRPSLTFTDPVKVEPNNLAQTNIDMSNLDNQGQWGDMGSLKDKNVRIGFIRKVYLILTAQLTFTFGIILICVLSEDIKNYLSSGQTGPLVMYIVSYCVFFTLIILFSFCQCTKGLRVVPYNYFLVAGITISFTYMLAMICAFHQTSIVIYAIAITLFITFGVTIVSMQTKFDFTNCWILLLCICFSLIGMGVACLISFVFIKVDPYTGGRAINAVYGGLCAIVMAIFLGIDTQLVIGNQRYMYHPEDYIDAALQLYLDIGYMFLYLLQALGSKK